MADLVRLERDGNLAVMVLEVRQRIDPEHLDRDRRARHTAAQPDTAVDIGLAARAEPGDETIALVGLGQRAGRAADKIDQRLPGEGAGPGITGHVGTAFFARAARDDRRLLPRVSKRTDMSVRELAENVKPLATPRPVG